MATVNLDEWSTDTQSRCSLYIDLDVLGHFQVFPHLVAVEGEAVRAEHNLELVHLKDAVGVKQAFGAIPLQRGRT